MGKAKMQHVEQSYRTSVLRLPILYRYLLREIASPFFIALSVFTGLLFLSKSLKLLQLIVSKDVRLSEIAAIFLLIIPQFLELALPMAFLLGLILAFGRLSSDSELVVIRASGLGLKELVRPVFLAASLVMLFSTYVSVSLRPWANTQLGISLFQLAKQRLSSGLVGGIFNNLGALTIYAERVEDEGSRLSNVIIADRRENAMQRIFIAKHGQIFSHEDSRTLNIKLFDGSIHEGRGQNYNITSFDSNSVTISEAELLQDDLANEGKKASEMSLSELERSIAEQRAQIDDPHSLDPKEKIRLARELVEWHRRFSLPATCLAVGLIGMALGIQPSRSGKSWGLAINLTVGILVITLFYFALAFFTALGEQDVLPAYLAMWLPNVFFALLAIYLFQKMESEEWLAVSQGLVDGLQSIYKKIPIPGRDS